MESNLLREDLLAKRMAWRNLHNLEYREPNKYKDTRDNAIAVKMLTCIGCIDYIMLYIEDDLVEMGKYRHNIKRVHNMYKGDVEKAHGMAYKLLADMNPKASAMYNDFVDYYFHLIWDSVLLEGIEKSMNILYSLSRILEKYNNEIKGRYDFAPSVRLYGAKERFSALGVKDYSLDALIMNIMHKKYELKEE